MVSQFGWLFCRSFEVLHCLPNWVWFIMFHINPWFLLWPFFFYYLVLYHHIWFILFLSSSCCNFVLIGFFMSFLSIFYVGKRSEEIQVRVHQKHSRRQQLSKEKLRRKFILCQDRSMILPKRSLICCWALICLLTYFGRGSRVYLITIHYIDPLCRENLWGYSMNRCQNRFHQVKWQNFGMFWCSNYEFLLLHFSFLAILNTGFITDVMLFIYLFCYSVI